MSLYIQTILIVFKGYLLDGSGLKRLQSTELGMTEIIFGLKLALKVRFSFEVCETEIA